MLSIKIYRNILPLQCLDANTAIVASRGFRPFSPNLLPLPTLKYEDKNIT